MNTMQHQPTKSTTRYTGSYLFGAPYRIDVYQHTVKVHRGQLCHPARLLYANGERRYGYVPVQQQQPTLRLVA